MKCFGLFMSVFVFVSFFVYLMPSELHKEMGCVMFLLFPLTCLVRQPSNNVVKLFTVNTGALCSIASIINPHSHRKPAAIDYGYRCSLDCPEALLHVWVVSYCCCVPCGLKQTGCLQTYNSIFQQTNVHEYSHMLHPAR